MAATCLVASMFMFLSCCPEELPVELEDPYVVTSIGDITKTSAVLYAQIFPYGNEVTISFQYAQQNSSDWTTIILEEKVSGNEYVMKSLAVNSLTPGTPYKYRVLANDISSEEKLFSTISIDKAKIFVYPAENVEGTTALVRADVIAGIEDNAIVSFKYSVKGSGNWQTIILPQKFFGLDTVKLKFDLSDLKKNTRYIMRWEVSNGGGIAFKEDSLLTCAVADQNGHWYHEVTIGTQTWLVENFRGTKFANGDPIPNVTDVTEWCNMTTPAYCWYNNDPENGKVYGGLYNWHVGADSRELIAGYKIPTGIDFVTLGNFLADGVTYKAGPALMEAGIDHWKTPSKTATNSSGFSGLPNGARGEEEYGTYGFMNLGENMTLWTNDKEDLNLTIAAMAEIDYKKCNFDPGVMHKKFLGVGIRLLKNN